MAEEKRPRATASTVAPREKRRTPRSPRKKQPRPVPGQGGQQRPRARQQKAGEDIGDDLTGGAGAQQRGGHRGKAGPQLGKYLGKDGQDPADQHQEH